LGILGFMPSCHVYLHVILRCLDVCPRRRIVYSKQKQ
jgi:hypothetical protein